MAKAIHMMIRVMEETRSVEFYRAALGLGIADRFEFDSFTLVYLRNPEADFEIELTINYGRTEPYALGNGYGHVAVAVDDLDAEHARLTASGLSPEPIKEFHVDGAVLLLDRPRRLPDRGAAAAWAVSLRRAPAPRRSPPCHIPAAVPCASRESTRSRRASDCRAHLPPGGELRSPCLPPLGACPPPELRSRSAAVRRR
jgi:lactoylglutathione lyase